MNILDKIENVSIVFGMCVSMADLQNVLSIIVLVFQVILIMVKCGIKIYDSIKHNKINDALHTIDETKEELKNFTKGDEHNEK